MATFNLQKMLSDLAELDAELSAITAKYRASPPREYAGDPLWPTYLEDLADNIHIVRERVQRGQYRLAQSNCGQFCMTFGKLHRTNGRVTITDLLFSLRLEVRNTTDMVNAGNLAGARAQLSVLAPLQQAVEQAIRQSGDARWAELGQPLLAAYGQWAAAVSGSQQTEAVRHFAAFMKEFPHLYQATF